MMMSRHLARYQKEREAIIRMFYMCINRAMAWSSAFAQNY